MGKVPGPDQMVSAEIIVAFAESPGYREAGDHGARIGFLFMRPQNRVTNAVEVEAGLVGPTNVNGLGIWFQPALDECSLYAVKVFEQGVSGLLSRLFWRPSEGEGRDRLSVTLYQVKFGSQCSIPI